MSVELPVDPSTGQPPGPGRRRSSPARDRLLETADRLLYENGLGASGIDWLISQAGIAKGTLYGNFSSKDDLIDSYLAARNSRTMDIFHAIEASDANLTEKVDAIFDYLKSQAHDDVFRGCAFVVAAAEVPDVERPPMLWARANKRAVHEAFLRMFTNAGAPHPRTLAEQICILYDGALITSAIRPESNAVDVARQMAHTLLAAT